MQSTSSADIVIRPGGGGDPAARLASAPRAAAKFRALRAAAEDAGAAGRALAERQADLAQRKISQFTYLDGLRRAVERGEDRVPPAAATWKYDIAVGQPIRHYGPPSQHQIDGAEADLRATETVLAEVTQRLAVHKARQSPIVSRIGQWLNGLPPNASLRDAKDKHMPVLPEGLRPSLTDIETARADVARAKAALDEIKAAPLPAREAKAIVARQIEELAGRGEIDTLRVVELGYPIRFPETRTGNTYAGVQILIPDALAVVCWLLKDAILEKLNSSIDEISDDKASLSAEQRKEREHDALDAIQRCERIEELLIETAEGGGLVIARRDDADPIAVLGLAAL